jgi:hypothetical protein
VTAAASELAGNDQLRTRVQYAISACCVIDNTAATDVSLIYPNIFFELNAALLLITSYHFRITSIDRIVEPLRHSKRRVSGNFFLALQESRAKYAAVAPFSRDLR